ncbi:hypothetical protein PABG_11309 [Paracoccidioides brasiliensis Pb03]|nr:hypothetical protein PABG_11309 [Paracoccidioides brasiliensis Pb03]
MIPVQRLIPIYGVGQLTFEPRISNVDLESANGHKNTPPQRALGAPIRRLQRDLTLDLTAEIKTASPLSHLIHPDKALFPGQARPPETVCTVRAPYTVLTPLQGPAPPICWRQPSQLR